MMLGINISPRQTEYSVFLNYPVGKPSLKTMISTHQHP